MLPPDVLEVLAKIHAEQRDVGETVEPPADAATLVALRAALAEDPGLVLPAAWDDLLSICDGLDFNGFTFYASRQSKRGLSYMLGMIEMNRLFERDESCRNLLLLGETGDDYFAYADGQYLGVGRVTLDPFTTRPDAAGLLREILTLAYTI